MKVKDNFQSIEELNKIIGDQVTRFARNSSLDQFRAEFKGGGVFNKICDSLVKRTEEDKKYHSSLTELEAKFSPANNQLFKNKETLSDEIKNIQNNINGLNKILTGLKYLENSGPANKELAHFRESLNLKPMPPPAWFEIIVNSFKIFFPEKAQTERKIVTQELNNAIDNINKRDQTRDEFLSTIKETLSNQVAPNTPDKGQELAGEDLAKALAAVPAPTDLPPPLPLEAQLRKAMARHGVDLKPGVASDWDEPDKQELTGEELAKALAAVPPPTDLPPPLPLEGQLRKAMARHGVDLQPGEASDWDEPDNNKTTLSHEEKNANIMDELYSAVISGKIETVQGFLNKTTEIDTGKVDDQQNPVKETKPIFSKEDIKEIYERTTDAARNPELKMAEKETIKKIRSELASFAEIDTKLNR